MASVGVHAEEMRRMRVVIGDGDDVAVLESMDGRRMTNAR